MRVEIHDLEVGQVFDLGVEVLSQEEIFAFANQFDPLPFHTDAEAAAKSRFGVLVASGPHLFMKVYRNHWIPRFGHSVEAGLEITGWQFMAPVVVNQPNHCQISVKALLPNPAKGVIAVTWHFRLLNDEGNPTQHLDMTVLHRLD